MTLYAPMLAASVTSLVIAILLLSKVGRLIQDVPNERSLHKIPTPRIGGLGIVAGIVAAWALSFDALPWWIILPMLGVFALSILDDVHGLPVRVRFLAQSGAALLVLLGSGLAAQPLLLTILLLVIVWMTNLYNFMDGSDGLAGGMAFFGFAAYGIAALLGGSETQALLNLSISAAAFGFLCFNFPPAKVFMGDAGSIPLGFLAATMGLLGWQQGLWAWWFPLLVFSPFVVDASVTLMRRKLRGAKITQAHREHYYQRLVQMGWKHRDVALAEYALMSISGGLALAGTQVPAVAGPAALVLGAGYVVLMLMIDKHWKALQNVRPS